MEDIPTVGYALLGLLALGPQSGYQLASRMRDPVAFFWTAPHSQIYPQLGRLQAAGLVSHRASEGPGPRRRKTYRLTDAGAAALRDWLAAPLARRPVKDELTLRGYLSWAGEPARTAELFEAEADRHAERLALYRGLDAALCARAPEAVDDPRRHEFGNHSALRAGIMAEELQVDWCRWMADRLRRR